MVREYLFSFHMSLTSVKHLLPSISLMNGQVEISKMSFSEMTNLVKVIRNHMKSFKNSEFTLSPSAPAEVEGVNISELFKRVHKMSFPLEMVRLLSVELMISGRERREPAKRVQKILHDVEGG